MLAPNFHGSVGFGHAFCRAISENWEVGVMDSLQCGIHNERAALQVGGVDTLHAVRALLAGACLNASTAA